MKWDFEYWAFAKSAMNAIAEYHLSKHPDKQFNKAIQELAELTVEITKWKEGDPNFEKLLDELFDAEFMIYQLKRLLIQRDHDHEIFNKLVNAKLLREIEKHGIDSK